MRRLLLFLLLAAGGLAALGTLAGGFQGAGKDAPKPELPLVTDGAGPDASKARVRMADLPLSERGGKQPNFEVQAAKLVTRMAWKDGGATWIDPVTRERIEFPFYPSMAISVDRPVPTRDSMTGTPGVEWQGWHLTVFRDVATLTRKEAESLQAEPLFRQQLVHYDVTATQGTAGFPISQIGDGQHKPGVRVVIHLTKDVVIKLVPDGMTIRTSDVTIDKDAGIASGPEAIEAESAAWSLRGKGFRIEKLTPRASRSSRESPSTRGGSPTSPRGGATSTSAPARSARRRCRAAGARSSRSTSRTTATPCTRSRSPTGSTSRPTMPA